MHTLPVNSSKFFLITEFSSFNWSITVSKVCYFNFSLAVY